MTDEREKQRRIVRRATLITVGFILAAVVVAVGGSALVAWFLSLNGLPFRTTWLVLTIVVLVVPVIGYAAARFRERRRGDGKHSAE